MTQKKSGLAQMMEMSEEIGAVWKNKNGFYSWTIKGDKELGIEDRRGFLFRLPVSTRKVFSPVFKMREFTEDQKIDL